MRGVCEGGGIGVKRAWVEDGAAEGAGDGEADIAGAVALVGRPVFAEPVQPTTKPKPSTHAPKVRHTAEPPIDPGPARPSTR